MRRFLLFATLLAPLGCGADTTPQQVPTSTLPAAASVPPNLQYPWLPAAPGPTGRLAQRFAPPPGCRRVPVAPGSWGEWLRWLPLHPPGTPARHFDGTLKDPQNVVAAVINIDVGPQDLQQCADAVIRLRGEYVFALDPNQVHFHLTTGYDFRFSDYAAGRTFRVVGNDVLPAARPPEALTHAALARYFGPAFGYAGTLSLSRELQPVPLAQVKPGDVLVHGGSPGHAVLVLDVAQNPATGQKHLLLAQSYMPAQSIHVLRNPEVSGAASAWFAVPTGPEITVLQTPEWTFDVSELGRF